MVSIRFVDVYGRHGDSDIVEVFAADESEAVETMYLYHVRQSMSAPRECPKDFRSLSDIVAEAYGGDCVVEIAKV